jgi:hypothetical protein
MGESDSREIDVRLSGAQQQVVSHRGSDLQVIACAGSGSTYSLVIVVPASDGQVRVIGDVAQVLHMDPKADSRRS